MNAWLIGLIVLACVFGGALFGTFLRPLLPEHHLRDDSKDVVKLGMGLVATMAALVLGLMIASAKGSYDDQKRGLDQMSASIVILDIVLAQYGPDTLEARHILRDIVADAIKRIWPEHKVEQSTLTPAAPGEGADFYNVIVELVPGDDRQRELRSTALALSMEMGRMRWLMVAQQEGVAVPFAFVVILVSWLTVLFTSFGLFAPSNTTVVAVLFVSALSVSGAVFLIMELAHPFDGLVQISSAPFSNAIGRLAQ